MRMNNKKVIKNVKLTLDAYLKTLFMLTILVGFSACDPARIIIIQNETEANIELEIALKDCENEWIQSLNENGEFKQIRLGTSQKEKTQSYAFGIGHWTEEDLDALIECTESIIIKKVGKSMRKIEGEELRKMLPDKKKGVFKNVMKIKILK